MWWKGHLLKGYNYQPYEFVKTLVKTQPRSQSSSTISDVTSPVKLLSSLSGNSRHCRSFQASSADSESANWRGDEAGQDRLSPSAEAQMGTARVSVDAKIGWYRFIMFPGKKPEDGVHWVWWLGDASLATPHMPCANNFPFYQRHQKVSFDQ